MRTAWELAVTKSLQHANVVSVHAVLTDVVVEKRSKRVIRFVPSVPQVGACVWEVGGGRAQLSAWCACDLAVICSGSRSHQ